MIPGTSSGLFWEQAGTLRIVRGCEPVLPEGIPRGAAYAR